MALLRKMKTLRRILRDGGLSAAGTVVQLKLRHYRAVRVCGDQLSALAKSRENYEEWLRRQQPDEETLAWQREAQFSHSLSLLIPTYNTDPGMLCALLDSILDQSCGAWEACIYDGCSTRPETLEILRRYAARDERIRVEFGRENGGISVNTNKALDMARYDWCALIDHDDLITRDAVFCILSEAERGAQMVYSDEDKCSEDGTRFFDPRLKPGFSVELLRSSNYICHLTAMETALMRRVGGLRPAFDGSQDHDLVLRASEQAKDIRHVPRVLYHWRQVGGSASHQKAIRCARAAAEAVREQLQRQELPGSVISWGPRVVWRDQALPESLTVVMHHADRASLALMQRVLPEIPTEVLAEAAEELSFRGKPVKRFTPDTLMKALEGCKGEMLLFAEGGVRMKKDFLPQLYLFARQKEIACAGAVLLRGRYLIEHAGWAVDYDRGALSWWQGCTPYASPELLADCANRNVTAVSRGLMMISREKFLRLGGFAAVPAAESDVLLGLAAQRQNLRCVSVWDVQAQLTGDAQWLKPDADSIGILRGHHEGTVVEQYLHPVMSRDYPGVMPDESREVARWDMP